MLLQSFNFVILAFGAKYWYARLVGTLMNVVCACCFMLPAWMLLFGARFSYLG